MTDKRIWLLLPVLVHVLDNLHTFGMRWEEVGRGNLGIWDLLIFWWCASSPSLQMQKWIHEKMQTACDDSHRDPTDLIGKLQKHQAFEAELSANKTTVEEVCKVCVGGYMCTCFD